MPGVAKIQAVSHFNQTCQILCTFFQVPLFQQWIAVQQHWLLPVT